MDPISQALILLAINEAPTVVNAAITMVQSIKNGEPTEAAIQAFLAVKHPGYADLLKQAAAKQA